MARDKKIFQIKIKILENMLLLLWAWECHHYFTNEITCDINKCASWILDNELCHY